MSLSIYQTSSHLTMIVALVVAYGVLLFDSRKLVSMHFDDADSFLGCEVIEDSAVIVVLTQHLSVCDPFLE
ncbi:MAG: hypothetical protein ACT4NY_26460 [Pseudonocardiales bacterium]